MNPNFILSDLWKWLNMDLSFSYTLNKKNPLQNILKYKFMTFVFITLQLQFFFVLQNKIIKWVAF